MTKTYAWTNATNSSKNINAVVIAHGTKAKMPTTRPEPAITHANPRRILSNAWPLIMLANRRMLRLNTRATYDINSIGISSGATANGTPDGKKFAANFHLFLITPIRVTAIKCDSASHKVITNELVQVKEYGSSPTKLEISITKNKVTSALKYQCRCVTRLDFKMVLVKPYNLRTPTVVADRGLTSLSWEAGVMNSAKERIVKFSISVSTKFDIKLAQPKGTLEIGTTANCSRGSTLSRKNFEASLVKKVEVCNTSVTPSFLTYMRMSRAFRGGRTSSL